MDGNQAKFVRAAKFNLNKFEILWLGQIEIFADDEMNVTQ